MGFGVGLLELVRAAGQPGGGFFKKNNLGLVGFDSGRGWFGIYLFMYVCRWV